MTQGVISDSPRGGIPAGRPVAGSRRLGPLPIGAPRGHHQCTGRGGWDERFAQGDAADGVDLPQVSGGFVGQQRYLGGWAQTGVADLDQRRPRRVVSVVKQDPDGLGLRVNRFLQPVEDAPLDRPP
jgi:hypothetical protein